MAETRAAKQMGNQAGQGAQAEEILGKLEQQASKWLRNVSDWVNQGDDLLSRTRAWLDEHPVSRDLAEKVVARVQGAPGGEPGMPLSERMENITTNFKTAAQTGAERIRQNPMETLAIAAAVGILGFVAFKSR
jgi:hypothetical protein